MDKRLCGKHAPDDIEQTAWVRETLKHVEEIVDACSLAENTLSDMLTFDRIEHGMLNVEISPISILPFVAGITRAFAIQVPVNA